MFPFKKTGIDSYTCPSLLCFSWITSLGVLYFHFHSSQSIFSLLISSSIQWLFRSVFNFHIVVSFSNFSVIFNFIFLWIPSPSVISTTLTTVFNIETCFFLCTLLAFSNPLNLLNFFPWHTYHPETYHILYYVYFQLSVFLFYFLKYKLAKDREFVWLMYWWIPSAESCAWFLVFSY